MDREFREPIYIFIIIHLFIFVCVGRGGVKLHADIKIRMIMISGANKFFFHVYQILSYIIYTYKQGVV